LRGEAVREYDGLKKNNGERRSMYEILFRDMGEDRITQFREKNGGYRSE
jgi:hypothetical protein